MQTAELVVPFLKSDEEALQTWQNLLAQDKDVPLDTIFSAACDIQREYYPYAIYDITCSTDWSAASFWEHREEYQVAKEKTVYIDYLGKEHRSNGTDIEVCNRHVYHHHRRPEQRIKYVTKNRTVVDNVEQVSGSVEPLKLTEYVDLSGFPGSSFAWVSKLSCGDFIEAKEDFSKGCGLKPQAISDEDALGKAKRDATDDMVRYAKNQVPGDRYEDFRTGNVVIRGCEKTVAYFSMYHIAYRYAGESYDFYLSGSRGEESHLFIGKPIDKSAQDRSAVLDSAKKETAFNWRTLLVFPLCGIVPFLWVAFPIFGLYVLATFMLYRAARAQLVDQGNLLDDDGSFLRAQILELTRNESIPTEQKQEMISGWIAEHSAGSVQETAAINAIVENYKRKIKLLNMACAIVVTAFFLLRFLGVLPIF